MQNLLKELYILLYAYYVQTPQMELHKMFWIHADIHWFNDPPVYVGVVDMNMWEGKGTNNTVNTEF
jgi:hypothetical protein